MGSSERWLILALIVITCLLTFIAWRVDIGVSLIENRPIFGINVYTLWLT